MVKPETTSVNEVAPSENVKDGAQSEVTDHTSRSSEKTAGNEKVPECDWATGDLAWARLSGYPFWPAMITLDPQEGIFTKTSVRGNLTLRRLHVQFFGDNGSRSWLHSSCVIRFEGLEAFNKLAAKLQSETNKRDLKLASAFRVAPKGRAKWDTAVGEAEVAMKKTSTERLQEFTRRFLQSTSVNKAGNQTASPQKKRQKRVHDDESSSKMTDEDHTASATADSNSNVSGVQVKKKKPILGGQDLHADFEAYLYKNIDRMSVEHPEWNYTTVEQYLLKEWNEMDNQLKPKYYVRFGGKNKVKHTKISSRSSEDVDNNKSEQADTTEASDSSSAPPRKLRNRGTLVRGTKQ